MARARIRFALAAIIPLMLPCLDMSRARAQLQSTPAPMDDSAAQAALVQFNALFEAAKPGGTLPRIADPAVRRLLDAIWDIRSLDPTRRAGAADVPVLLRFCAAGGGIWQAYFQFNPRGRGNPDLDGNMTTYADEIMPGFAFSVRCAGASLEAAGAYVASLPAEQMNQARRDGWNRMRAGAAQVALGALATLGDASVAPTHASELARALNDSAPRFAAGLERVERQTVVAAARTTLASVRTADVRAALEAFVSALSKP